MFSIDGSPITSPLPVVDGVASTTWQTFGADEGVSYVITAVDCSVDECGPDSAPVTVTVSNPVPVLTAPVNGQIVGTDVTLSATATGGAVGFSIDGVQVGLDTTAPFSFEATSLTEGLHSASVQGCDTTGFCFGPVSPVTSFLVKVLHPNVTSIEPSLFSPNGDGRRDTTTVNFSLPDTENVSYQIVRDATGLVVRSHGLGALSAGSHAFVWNGLDAGSHRVPDGTYTVSIVTSKALAAGGQAHGHAHRSVKVDDTAPTLSSVSGASAKFYPYPDGYADTFKPSVTMNSAGTLSLYVSTPSGHVVRLISAYHSAAGRYTLTWDGKNSSRVRVGAGTYLFWFRAEDSAGNRRSTGKYRVFVSGQKLVAKSVTLTLNGNRGALSASDPSCSQYSYGLSGFAHGVWLYNFCDPNSSFDAIFADYNFTVPAAIRYNSIHVQSYGNTLSAPERIAALVYNYSSAKWAAAGAVRLTRNKVNGGRRTGRCPARRSFPAATSSRSASLYPTAMGSRTTTSAPHASS